MLEVRNLVRAYRLPRAHPFAPARSRTVLHGVSLHIAAGEALGLVGESGSGKSTLARAVLGLEPPQDGTVRLDGQDMYALPARARRGTVGAVFQDPYGSLDPRMRVGASLAEPLLGLRPALPGAERQARVAAMLEAVGLPAEDGEEVSARVLRRPASAAGDRPRARGPAVAGGG